MNWIRWIRGRSFALTALLLGAVAVAGGMSGATCGATSPPTDNGSGGIGNNLPVEPPTTQPDSSGAQNAPPVVTFQWPYAPVSLQAGTVVNVQWTVRDPEDSARVSVFARDANGSDAAIATGVPGTPPVSQHSQTWNTGIFPPGPYQIVSIANDGKNPPQTNVAAGVVTILPRPVEPPLPPPQNPPNAPPSMLFNFPTSETTVNQGSVVDIRYTFRDTDDPVKISIIADPDTVDANTNEITLLDSKQYAKNPAQQQDTFSWTTSVPPAVYRIIGIIDDGSGLPGHRVTVQANGTIRVLPVGTPPENGPPNLSVLFPVTDAGLSQDDSLDIIFSVSDPNSDTDDLTISFYFDRDNNPDNDAADPPIKIQDPITITAGSLPPNVPGRFILLPAPIIDTTVTPVREETDEGGRPYPYYVRLTVEDGKGGKVDAYASGKIRILGSANDVVDLISTGGSTAGAILQGFNGDAFVTTRGSHAGNAMTTMGDMDLDGNSEFAISAGQATPFNRDNVGIAYLIYGRKRAIDRTQNFAQGRYSGVFDLNSVGTFVPFPPNDPFFQTFYNIRGTQLFYPTVGPGGSRGITSLAMWPDITGDGTAELVLGAPWSDSIDDFVDPDPCDNCEFASPPDPQFICYGDRTFTAPGSPITGTVRLAGTTLDNTWTPRDPTPAPDAPNSLVDSIQLDTRLVQLSAFSILLSGRVEPTVRVVDFEPGGVQTPQVAAQMTVTSNPPQPPPPERDIGVDQSPNRSSGRWGIDMAPNQSYTFTFTPGTHVFSNTISAYFVFTGTNVSGTMTAYNRDPLNPMQVQASAVPSTGFNSVPPVTLPLPRDADGNPLEPFEVDRIEFRRTGSSANSLVSIDDFRFTFVGDFMVDVQLESSEGPIVTGQIVRLDPGQTDGTFQNARVTFPVGAYPLSLDGNGHLNGVPPSVYDGFFTTYVRPHATVTFQDSGVEIFGATATGTARNFAYQYFDLFPDEVSTANCPPQAGDIWVRGARAMTPACPLRNGALQYNDDSRSDVNTSGYTCDNLNVLAITSPSPQNRGSTDFLYRRGTPYTTPYVTGYAFAIAGDAILLPPFGNNGGLRTADIGAFGQTLPGAHFRGSWLGPTDQPDYDPNSRFGETVDTMPDINDTPGGRYELVVSAPGAGQRAVGVADLSASLAGDYDGANPTRSATNVKLTDTNGDDLGFNAFSRGLAASLILRIRYPIAPTPDGPSPKIEVAATSPAGTITKDVMLWGRGQPGFGDLQIDAYLHDGGTTFTLNVAMPPEQVDPFVNPTGRGNTTGITVSVTRLPDCTIAPTTFTVISATWRVVGLSPDQGMVRIFDGLDYSNPAVIASNTGNGVASYPIPQCLNPTNPFTAGGPRRGITSGEGAIAGFVTTLTGRRPRDEFGWAHYCGDVNRDGISDFACGSPGSDLDPLDLSNPTVYPPGAAGFDVDNGTAWVIFGTRALGSGPVGRPFERIEVRGTHPGDHLGKVQGAAGYFRGPTVPGQEGRDVFFGCPDYDANTNAGEPDSNPGDSYDGFPLVPVYGQNIPQVGKDAGFVGVLFGSDFLTGERTLRLEQIGTGNFVGVKFFGGQAEGRLGQSVSSAGDFNRDGNDDLIMTAPGQTWPGAKFIFNGSVQDGEQVTVNGHVFEFDTSGNKPPVVSPNAIAVDVSGNNSAGQPRTNAADAEAALRAAMKGLSYEVLGIGAVLSRSQFPDPQPDVPTTIFLARQPDQFALTTASPSIQISHFTRQGVTYLVFGQSGDALLNKIFLLPQDLNRRDATGKRILKGIVFVGPYETPGGEIAISFGGRDEVPSNSNERGLRLSEASAFVTVATPSSGAVNDLAVPTSPFRSSTFTDPQTNISTAWGYDVPAGKTETFVFGTRRAAQLNFFLAVGEGATQATVRFYDTGGLLLRTETLTTTAGQTNSRYVLYGSTSCIARMSLEVTGANGKASIDDLRVLTGTPEDSPAEMVSGLGDIDGDGFPDIGIGAPRVDFFNILEPCNRRREAGEVYVIYGNRFGLNEGSKP